MLSFSKNIEVEVFCDKDKQNYHIYQIRRFQFSADEKENNDKAARLFIYTFPFFIQMQEYLNKKEVITVTNKFLEGPNIQIIYLWTQAGIQIV